MDDLISRQALLDAFGFSENTRKWGGDHSGYDTMMLYEIQDMIESAPSVNPQHSGDLISRQDAIKAIDEKAKRIKNADTLNGLAGAVGILFDLPSVKPQEPSGDEWEDGYKRAWAEAEVVFEKEPNTGHWITDVDKWGDIVTTVNGYRCDKCNAFNSDKDNYCPNCGARMVEPQESEVKE